VKNSTLIAELQECDPDAEVRLAIQYAPLISRRLTAYPYAASVDAVEEIHYSDSSVVVYLGQGVQEDDLPAPACLALRY
jgi:hypothetical protein